MLGFAMDDRLFDTVFVRMVPNSYPKAVAAYPDLKDIKIDMTLARRQHRDFVSALKEAGLRVIGLPKAERFGESVFVEDPGILGLEKSVISRFGEKRRFGEEQSLLKDLKRYRAEIGVLKSIRQNGRLEGGDVIITESRILIGRSGRTNAAGIMQFSGIADLPVTTVPTKTYHLKSASSYLNKNRMIIAPGLVDMRLFRGFRPVLVPDTEAGCANVIYVGNSEVIVPTGCPKTVARLKALGYKPIEMNISEYSKDCGSITCLCSPVYKVF